MGTRVYSLIFSLLETLTSSIFPTLSDRMELLVVEAALLERQPIILKSPARGKHGLHDSVHLELQRPLCPEAYLESPSCVCMREDQCIVGH